MFPLQFWEVCSTANSTSRAVRLSEQMQREQTNTLKHDPICLFVWALRETHTERGRNKEGIEGETAGRGWERMEKWSFSSAWFGEGRCRRAEGNCGGCMWRDSRSGRSQPVLYLLGLFHYVLIPSVCVCADSSSISGPAEGAVRHAWRAVCHSIGRQWWAPADAETDLLSGNTLLLRNTDCGVTQLVGVPTRIFKL